MIKVGIIGAETPDAGELLRILIHHPEVEVMCLYSPSAAGRQVSAIHHGFIGEKIMNFTDSINPAKLDAIFIADDSSAGKEVVQRSPAWPNLRIIDLSPSRFDNWDKSEMEYGLSEMNRKALVRGARQAVVPTPASSLTLIGLYPIAANLMLSSDLSIIISAPKDVASRMDEVKTAEEVARQLKKVQPSFEGSVTITVEPNNTERFMKVQTLIKSPLALPEVGQVYDNIYDDHNFTFTSLSDTIPEEVAGTQKCIVTFSKPGAGLLEIDVAGDCRMRGGAGDALHLMNLLFSLHEKVGLHLKPSCYGANPDRASRQTSWFA